MLEREETPYLPTAKAIAPNAPSGAAFMMKPRILNMTPVRRWTPSRTGAPTLPMAFRATPKITAMKMIWRMSPSTKGATTLVGMTWVRNCHHSWWAPSPMRLAAESVVLIALASALTPSPRRKMLMATKPKSRAKIVPIWKYVRAFSPVMPTFFRSATLAMPPTMVRNTIGPISILMALTKVVPIGSMAMPAAGASQPTRMPRTMPVNTQKYSCLYQRFLGAGMSVPAVVMCPMIPTSLWNVSGDALSVGVCTGREPVGRSRPVRCVAFDGGRAAGVVRFGASQRWTEALDGRQGAGQGLDDGIGDVRGGGVAADVAGQVAGAGCLFDGGLDAAGFLVEAKVVQHQGCAGDRADRVADALARDVRGRAVHRLEHGREAALRVQVCAGRQAEAAGQGRAEVGEDVGVQVGGDDHGEVFRVQDELGAHRVDQDALGGDIGVVQGNPLEGFVPEDHAVLLGVGLGDGGDLLHRAGPGEIEREAHDALAALLGEQRGLQGDIVARAAAAEVPPAEACVLAFTVFADHNPVELGGVGLAQRGLDAREELHRTDVGPLVKVLRDIQAQAPEADVVRDVFPADSAEVDGVEILEGVQSVGVHHLAGLGVVLAAPWELGPFEGELAAGILRQGVQDPASGGDDLFADPVCGD